MSPSKEKKKEITGGSLELLLELLKLLLGGIATRSSLLRELICFFLLYFVQLNQLFLTCWHSNLTPSLADSICFFPSYSNPVPLSKSKNI